MTDAERPVCDCPDPRVRQPCQVKTACVRKVMTPMARRSPALFELLEAWVLEDNEKWSRWDMRAMSARRFRPLS